MKGDNRYVVGGAAFGAVLGASVGLLLSRKSAGQLEKSGAVQRSQAPIESGQLVRLGGMVVALIRQIMALG